MFFPFRLAAIRTKCLTLLHDHALAAARALFICGRVERRFPALLAFVDFTPTRRDDDDFTAA